MQPQTRKVLPLPIKATPEGIVIPRELLDGFEEFEEAELVRENGKIIVIPKIKHDPIFEFGKNPVRSGIRNASVNLDPCLYGSPKIFPIHRCGPGR